MAEVTAQLVKELREMTGAGMMECKKALTAAEGELEKAVDVLRTRGLAAAAKKAGRATNEGRVVALLNSDANIGVLVEVNCETDFVSRNEVFAAFADKIAAAVLNNAPADLDALKVAETEGQSVEALLTEAIHTIGENIQISRFARVVADGGALASYIHGGGRLGILAQFAFEKPETATAEAFLALSKDIAMQIAAANPGAVARESFSAQAIEREKAIYKAQAAESGKSEEIQEKMATGRLEKFFKENALLEQAFIEDTDRTVRSRIDEVGKQLGDVVTVVGFHRFELGGN
jgi:elongation factor Ts